VAKIAGDKATCYACSISIKACLLLAITVGVGIQINSYSQVTVYCPWNPAGVIKIYANSCLSTSKHHFTQKDSPHILYLYKSVPFRISPSQKNFNKIAYIDACGYPIFKMFKRQPAFLLP